MGGFVPLGILGGGQLGRMTSQAASVLGIDVVIGEYAADSPAARVSAREVRFRGGWDDDDALAEMARAVPVVTLESEFVDAGVLERLEALGTRVLPTPASVRTVQDKLWQKQALAAAGLPVPAFHPVSDPADVVRAGEAMGWPVMLKARRNGYDGRGNARVAAPDDAAAACSALGWPERELYVEAHVGFERELADIVVRTPSGDVASYPVVETIQDPDLHICREVLAPAPVAGEIQAAAARIAVGAVEAVGGFGTFGVELFQTGDGGIMVNELAPRPHNSGHYTIDACPASQFANHVRAVLGLPLAPAVLRAPAVMVNLLGTGGPAVLGSEDLARALAVPAAFVHLYGKRENRPGRKLGHVTALGRTLDEARERARRAAAALPV